MHPLSLRTPECLKSYALYLSIAENGVDADIDRNGIAGHTCVSSDTQKHLEAHHRSHEGSVTRRVVEQDSRSSVTREDDNVEPKPFTAVDRLNFKDSGSQIRSVKYGDIFIFWEVCQIVFEVIIPVGKFPVLETAKNVHPLRELIVKPYAEYVFTASAIEA